MFILANFIHTNNIPELKQGLDNTEQGQQEVECFNHHISQDLLKPQKNMESYLQAYEFWDNNEKEPESQGSWRSFSGKKMYRPNIPKMIEVMPQHS